MNFFESLFKTANEIVKEFESTLGSIQKDSDYSEFSSKVTRIVPGGDYTLSSEVKSVNGDYTITYTFADAKEKDAQNIRKQFSDICDAISAGFKIINPKTAKLIFRFDDCEGVTENTAIVIDWDAESNQLFINNGNVKRFYDKDKKIFIGADNYNKAFFDDVDGDDTNEHNYDNDNKKKVEFKEVDNSIKKLPANTKALSGVIAPVEKQENSSKEDLKERSDEYDEELKKTAFNLKAKLDKEIVEKGESEPCEECEVAFCPEVAVDLLADYLNDGDDDMYSPVVVDGEAVGVEVYAGDLYDNSEKDDDYVYHNEKWFLDSFCELVCEKLGFTNAYWTADFETEEDEKNDGKVEGIYFTLEF